MLDLNQVGLFVQVVEAGSFAEAARRLNMPANTVSRQIQQLEDDLGLRLMQRSTRKLTLTDAGVALHEGSFSQIEQILAAAEQVGRGSMKPSGTVHVAAPTDFLEFFSPEWIAEFLKVYPDVRLDLVLSDARADLVGGGIDVALRGGELDDSNLVARKVARFTTVIVASPLYLAERGTPTTVGDLSEHDCIKSSKPGSRTSWHFVGPDGPVEVGVMGRVSAGTAQARLLAANAGLGIAVLPEVLAYRHLRSGSLIEVLPTYSQPGTNVYAVYPSRKLLAPAVSAFIEFYELKVRRELLPILRQQHRNRLSQPDDREPKPSTDLPEKEKGGFRRVKPRGEEGAANPLV